MIKKFVILATAALLAGCVTATSAFNEQNKIGKIYSGKVSVPQGQILLPPGDWKVVGKSISKNNSGQPFGEVVLARIDADKNLDGLVMFATALETSMRYSFYATDYCDPDQSTLYYEQSANQEGGNQKCFIIEDWSLHVGANANERVKQAEAYFRGNNIKKPETMVFSNYRFSRRNKLLTVQYGFNYRQPTDEVIPGYIPEEKFSYDRPFGTELWKTNLETIIAWTKEHEEPIADTFLN
ncbi:hypothetical protein [Thalassospira tepidiphila]|uniref:hypothetical protein n=1 Tax=Thalassospira tepidiphila TaxID=393657 RepID=UPI002926AF5C|nr:hypothetical protein MACH01_08330 [Thalassospira tepidiphila]